MYQDKRYKNRELQIMKELCHPNVVNLQHAFYTQGDKVSKQTLFWLTSAHRYGHIAAPTDQLPIFFGTLS